MQGRSPTCYSPVRHSSTPEGAFPFDLHVLSTPPAFVLSQDQTLQTKTPTQTVGESINQRNLTNKTKTTPHTRGSARHGKKQQQNKTTKHTIEFSNNTHQQATLPLYSAAQAPSTALALREETPCIVMLGLFYALNLCSETDQIFDEQRIATVDVKDIVHLGVTVGDQSGQHQPGASPDVR